MFFNWYQKSPTIRIFELISLISNDTLFFLFFSPNPDLILVQNLEKKYVFNSRQIINQKPNIFHNKTQLRDT